MRNQHGTVVPKLRHAGEIADRIVRQVLFQQALYRMTAGNHQQRVAIRRGFGDEFRREMPESAFECPARAM